MPSWPIESDWSISSFEMGEELDQADVFILAYDPDSLLIEVAERTH